MASVGLYLHIPFCRAKCAYCDFNSYPHQEYLHTRYVHALCEETRQTAERYASPLVDTIYVGGGTPTLLPTDLLLEVLTTCVQSFPYAPETEISLEANPGTISLESLRALRLAGVNRLSLGAQSFHECELRLLQRIHNADQIGQSVDVARRAGFGNLNLDLIYGLPGQTLSDWQYNLEQALCLAPQHLSLYALSVEDGTPLAQSIANGQLAEPDEDLAADMYDWSEERLEQASFEHYEISNWALPGLESRHNLKYWRREPYLGMGAGSHSCWGNQRYSNVCYPRSYVEHIEVGQSVVEESQCINPLQQQAEAMMLGLRLLEGISCVHFAEQYGRDPRSAYARDIAELQSEGLLALDGDRLHLTRHGHLLANQVFVHFWPPDTDAH